MSDPNPPQSAESASPGDAGRFMEMLYDEFRRLAAYYLERESPGHTLQPTALVNEAYLKLAGQLPGQWQGRTHFFAVGAQAMRRILVDHARSKGRLKRGGDFHRIDLGETRTLSRGNDMDLLEVNDAIEELAKIDSRQAKIVELRFFGGLTVAQTAEALGVSRRTVEADWTLLRAWLRRRFSDEA